MHDGPSKNYWDKTCDAKIFFIEIAAVRNSEVLSGEHSCMTTSTDNDLKSAMIYNFLPRSF